MSWLIRASDREMGLCPECGSSIIRDYEGLSCLDAGHQWEYRNGALARPIVVDPDSIARGSGHGGLGQRVNTIVHGNRLSRQLEARAARHVESVSYNQLVETVV